MIIESLNAAASAMPMPFAKSSARWSGRFRCAKVFTCSAYCAETSTFVTSPTPAGGSFRLMPSKIFSMSLMPVAPEIGTAFALQSLQPFHSFVLCEAVIITEPSAFKVAFAK